jgi:hypothetical protein
MKAIASLGSTFFAFLAGAIVAAGTTVIIAIFLESRLPTFWWILLLSGFALTVSSVFLLRLTVSLSSLEAALAAIPLSMDLEERQRIIDRMTVALRKSAWIAVIASTVFVAMGVAALPTRLALIKEGTSSIDHSIRRIRPGPDSGWEPGRWSCCSACAATCWPARAR